MSPLSGTRPLANSIPHGPDASDTLLLGRESAGVPDDVHQRADARIRIAMREGLRSLNIAVAAAIVLGEALRQTSGFPVSGSTAS